MDVLKKDKILQEPEWILKTPYNLERHHVARFTKVYRKNCRATI